MVNTGTSHFNMRLFSYALLSLSVGVLIYVTDRPGDATYFVHHAPFTLSLYETVPPLFGPFGFFLPSFLHVLSFSLLFGVIIDAGKKGALFVSLLWFFVGSLFEVGQMYGEKISLFIPPFFAQVPFLECSANFFMRGTFDYYDIAGNALGAITAYYLMYLFQRRSSQ